MTQTFRNPEKSGGASPIVSDAIYERITGEKGYFASASYSFPKADPPSDG